jgi:hypothetical protein
MDITAIAVVLGALALCGFVLWRSSRRLGAKVSALEAERLRRRVAEWRYERLKEAIQVEGQSAPKVLAVLEMRIKWIEHPPPEAFEPEG